MRVQKFPKFTKVRVASDLGPAMDHFGGKGRDAIVEYTYHQRYGGGNTDSYCLGILNKSGDKVEFSSSWYHEHQLTKIGKPSMKNARLIEEYESRDP